MVVSRRSPRKRKKVNYDDKAKLKLTDGEQEADESSLEEEHQTEGDDDSSDESVARRSPAAKSQAHTQSSHNKKKSTNKKSTVQQKPKTKSRPAPRRLQTMTKTVLSRDEPEDSLLAILLLTPEKKERDAKLAAAATELLKREDWNEILHVLASFLMRSVGAKETDVEIDLENEDQITTVLETAAEQMEEAGVVLMEDSPEYRDRFAQAWQQLGIAAMDSFPGDDEESLMADGPVIDLYTHLADFVSSDLTAVRTAATTGIYHVTLALLQRTAELSTKVSTAKRQILSSHRQPRKKLALQEQVKTWEGYKKQWESAVEKHMVPVLLKRYRDVRPEIRQVTVHMLSQFAIVRPDIFLKGSYLKYLGWLLNDKHYIVRQAAIQGFFDILDDDPDNVMGMKKAIERFVPRLCDCARDVNEQVQEVTFELFKKLADEGLLDEAFEDDDEPWEKLNMRVVAPNTSAKARYNATLFLLDQLEAFDGDSDNLENTAFARIDALVDWLVHNLGRGEIPVEHVRYELADLLVASIRAHPEHKSLASNWDAMMRLLDRTVVNQEHRQDAIKQRFVLRVLVSAVEMEVSSLKGASLVGASVDADLAQARKAAHSALPAARKKGKQKKTSSHEELTVSLVRALPTLLSTFKEEESFLEALTSLPQHFLPSVFNLASRKRDFQKLVKKISEVFLQSTSCNVISNCALTLTALASADHARSDDAQAALRKTFQDTFDRVLTLVLEKAEMSKSKSTDDAFIDSLVETMQSICLCLRRLCALSKRTNISVFLVDTDGKADDDALEELFNSLAEHVAHELDKRKPISDDDGDFTIPEIWETMEEKIHSLAAESVVSSLRTMLSLCAWRLKTAIDQLEEGDNKEDDDAFNDGSGHIVYRMRDEMQKLLILCFEQHVEPDEFDVGEEHKKFAFVVQKEASSILGDMRSLFPKAWSSASSSFLARCHLDEDQFVSQGLFRFLRFYDEKSSDPDFEHGATSILLPLVRGLMANWKVANRREAGAALAYIVGGDPKANSLVTSMTRTCRKISPVRYLEAQMAGLVSAFEAWLDAEPEEIESQHPTDEELTQFEEAEKVHKERFYRIEQQAYRMSSSLGVGKLKDKLVIQAMRGFIKEGIRYSFDAPNEEDACGFRLAFLRLVTRYVNWIRKDRSVTTFLGDFLDSEERKLRADPEYDTVLDEDKEALKLFRKAGNFGDYVDVGMNTPRSQRTDRTRSTQLSSAESSAKRPRASGSSSVGSGWSKRSLVSASLSPVYEGNSDDDEGPPAKRKRSMGTGEDNSISSTVGDASDGSSSESE